MTLAGRSSTAEARKAQLDPPNHPARASLGQWTPSHTRLSGISSDTAMAVAIIVQRSLTEACGRPHPAPYLAS